MGVAALMMEGCCCFLVQPRLGELGCTLSGGASSALRPPACPRLLPHSALPPNTADHPLSRLQEQLLEVRARESKLSKVGGVDWWRG